MKNLIIVMAAALNVMVAAAVTQAQMPGDTVGQTQYYNQSQGPCGNRVLLDSLGTVYVTWTNGSNNNTVRHIYFNHKTADGWDAPGVGMQVSLSSGAGYPCLALLPDDQPAILYHRTSTTFDSIYMFTTMEVLYPPNRSTPNHRYVWPNFAIDRSGRIHVVATWKNLIPGSWMDFMYTRSDDGGYTWTPVQSVDTLTTVSPIIVSSPVSDRVAIIYSHPTTMESQTNNDVYCIVSDDGINWDWNDRINLTGYGQGDSLFALADHDAIFDYDDRLHIAWVGCRVDQDQIPFGSVYLYQYVDDPGINVEVTRYELDDTCEVTPWSYAVSNISLSASRDGGIYAVYSKIECPAINDNGELFAQASYDGGLGWGQPVNITNTPAHSEIYPFVAERADTALHVFYLGYTGDGVVYHMMMYYPFPLNLLGGIDDMAMPCNFALHQNYPNPFNAATTIPIEMGERTIARLTIYDIVGREVAVPFSGTLGPGRHQVVWRPGDTPSGVYFARLSSGESAITRRMILLK
jgi:hypothetical protein